MPLTALIIVALVGALIAVLVYISLFKALRTRWYRRGYRLNTFLRFALFLIGSASGLGAGSAVGAGLGLAHSFHSTTLIGQIVGVVVADLALVVRASRRETGLKAGKSVVAKTAALTHD